MSQLLQTSIEYLKGVGPKRAELLKKGLNIHTFGDLMTHYPFRYVDKTKFYTISELHPDLPYIQIVGEFVHIETIGATRQKRLSAIFKDDTGRIQVVWFKGIKFLGSTVRVGVKYVLYGKVNAFNNSLSIVHPELETLVEYKNTLQSTLQAVYASTEKLNNSGLNSKNIVKLQKNLFTQIIGKIPENLSSDIIDRYKLLSREKALVQLHFPKNAEILKRAIFRLKFEELFFIQLELLKLKLINTNKTRGFAFPSIGDYFNHFYEQNLAFELTNAQKRVLKEIRKDMGTGRQMNRLLQGDVGSGKTVVGLMSMLMAIDNGFQACLMAPTEILAQQHYASLSEMLEGMPVKISLLTGSVKVKERRIIHKELESGELHILVGTHALLEDKVKFHNLGLCVIDEQHRFGVAQRARLWKKNSNGVPHILVMTATPIPRTLAMTLYGDLDVSVIDELPPGRKPIETIHWFENKRERLWGVLREQIKLGRQVYIVYPLIDESEKMDYANLQAGFEDVLNKFPRPDYQVSIVHGQMTNENKEFEMQRFVKGETHIMVATTVIEVGVNVPNASLMVIESAERFGLSQLHQLRGRVGRGAEQSYCYLMTGYKLSDDGKLRMKTMTETNDGFQIAEVDLKLRGPGDLSGTQQSGVPVNLKLTNLAKDGQMIEIARNAAKDILDKDPNLQLPEHQPILAFAREQQRGKTNWSRIS